MLEYDAETLVTVFRALYVFAVHIIGYLGRIADLSISRQVGKERPLAKPTGLSLAYLRGWYASTTSHTKQASSQGFRKNYVIEYDSNSFQVLNVHQTSTYKIAEFLSSSSVK